MKRTRGKVPRQLASTRRPAKRSKNEQHASPPPVAEDMLVEIFSRLPANTVARWRPLSRSWAATLTSASFTDLHFKRANHSQRQQQQKAGAPPKLFFTTAVDRLEAWRHDGPPVLRELTGDALSDLSPQHPDRNHYSHVIVTAKPCHGLVLVLRWPCHGHYVCNPCTGAVLPLPDTKTPSRMCGRDTRPNTIMNRVSYGLGYDSAAKEHKVVRLFSLHEEDADAVTTCEHFLQSEGDGILTFDVSDETFGSLMPPPGLRPIISFELAVLDRCLCLHYTHDLFRSDCDTNFYIWRLTSYDGAGQWEQLYCIKLKAWSEVLPQIDIHRDHQITPLEIYSDGNGHKKIMFSTTCALTVFTVDLDLAGGDGAPKILFSLPTDNFTKTSSGTHAVGLLEESLVSVGRPSEEIILSSPSTRAWSEVLKWWPTNSVVPLKRVCKDWGAVIRSDRFTQLHTTVHATIGKKRPRITLVAPFYGLFLPLNECCDRVIEQIDRVKFLSFNSRGSRVLCSKPCHDLVAGSCTNGQGFSWDFVCNPIMGYYERVYMDPDGHDSFLDGRIGLGYDSMMNTHVLVRLVYHERNITTRDYHLECYVYLAHKESWRPISPPLRPVAEMQSAYADGKFYWMVDPNLGSTSSSGCELLVLDISMEEFEVLEGPPL
ncbi:unnamed protein product [Alopecurus aequalis]